MRTGSPPIPGSPLTYSPQLPMTPQDAAPSAVNTEYSGVAGWPAQPKLLPTVIICEFEVARLFQLSLDAMPACARSYRMCLQCPLEQAGPSHPEGAHGGNHVEVEGSFDNWTTRQPMQRSGRDFTIVKLLPPGVYQVSTPAAVHGVQSGAIMNVCHATVHSASAPLHARHVRGLFVQHRSTVPRSALMPLCSTSLWWTGSGSTRRTRRRCTTRAATSTTCWRCRSTCPRTWTACPASIPRRRRPPGV